jgi:hypothetical protein
MQLRFFSALILAAATAAVPAWAQLAGPNSAGVSGGHHVFRAKDIDAANKFWQDLGGQPAPFGGRLNIMKFPGILILEVGGAQAQAKGAPPPPPVELAGSEGSTVEFIGFVVKDLKASLAKWATAGIRPLPGGSATEVFLMTPDKIKVRVTEVKSITVPIAADSVKMVVPNAAEAKAWYTKNFGLEIPGASITFEQAKGAVAPTKGRALDRIGLEVVGLEAFSKKLEAAGVKFDSPYRYTDAMKAGFAVFQDPWGTLVELSEGLSAIK